MMANIFKEPTGNFDPTRPLTRDIDIIEKPKEKWFQCTHCDAESQSFKAFEFCKQKRHEVIAVYRPAELSQKQIEELNEDVKNIMDDIMKNHGSVENFFFLQEMTNEAYRKSVKKQARLWEKIKDRERNNGK